MLYCKLGFAKEVVKTTICLILASMIFPKYISINETWMIALIAGVVIGAVYLVVVNLIFNSEMSVFKTKVIATALYFIGFILFSIICPGFRCTLLATLILSIGLSPMIEKM